MDVFPNGSRPNTQAEKKAEQHSSTAHVLGPLGQRMPFSANSVDGRFNAGV